MNCLEKPKIEELIEHSHSHACPPGKTCVVLEAIADLPTRFGNFQIAAFYNNRDDKEHVAVLRGDICGKEDVPVRLHSECLTGDAVGSLRCDCREQLIESLKFIGKMDAGIVLYLRQEGRGIGLTNKIKAYQLQDAGHDTAEANKLLGFRDDERDYEVAAHMLRTMDVKSAHLITNNPKKIEELAKHGIKVSGRIPIEVKPNAHNIEYLKTKKEKFGHMLKLDEQLDDIAKKRGE